ncbi:MAG: tetratricopeptide repeat protein [Acidobacteria bacterium]|nr:tetratricopeptide repeat protein [Acidobacteriota bacterium]
MRTVRITVMLCIACSAPWGCAKNHAQDRAEELNEKVRQDPSNVSLLVDLGRAYHDAENPGKAIEALDRALSLDEGNPVAMVYLGSSYTKKARDASAVDEKVESLNKGFILLDQAVAKSPDNYLVRMVRGFNSLGIPDLFSRGKYAIEDFEYLLKRLEVDPKVVPNATIPRIYYGLTLAYRRNNQPEKAEQMQQRLLREYPESEYVKALQPQE